MNRHQRRREEALLRAREKRAPKLKPAREDGRPLYFDVGMRTQYECFYCRQAGLKGIFYGVNEIFMTDPANSPDGSGDIHMVCRGHLPDNAVIYNPPTNKCRNKSGDHEWQEDNVMLDLELPG